MGKDTGGFAFPVSTIDGFTENGMTLRDWFAGQCLLGQLSYYGNEGSEEKAALYAYRFADAMLAERSKP